ncbi:hypothetical protein [Streptomyces sp. NPDC046759]|uniref:hypothetical protein n=1 Tax=Streptomyces sp. NPDC046759 TaxID=3155019 RepID=UPI0033E11C7C
MDLPGDRGEDIDVSSPHEAYADAPALRHEIHQVLALGAERDGRRPRTAGAPSIDAATDSATRSATPSATAERAWLLRRAALMDRMALKDPDPGPAEAAAQTAGQLVLHDRRHHHLAAGPHRPDTVALPRDRRLYVRQEYAAWVAAGRPGAA